MCVCVDAEQGGIVRPELGGQKGAAAEGTVGRHALVGRKAVQRKTRVVGTGVVRVAARQGLLGLFDETSTGKDGIWSNARVVMWGQSEVSRKGQCTVKG